MARLPLLLVALFIVKALAISRPKRTAAKVDEGAVLEWGGGVRLDDAGDRVGGHGTVRGARVVRQAKKKKKDRSTSSSSGAKGKDDSNDGKDSIAMSLSDSSESKSKKKNKYVPKSTEERHKWRKWHRKCHRCPVEEKKKWRDPSIKWICGAYQRARRSFKSICMMHYRNCQDGTMFTKIHDHRCQNASSSDPQPRGQHFFYDYKVRLSEDTSSSKGSGSSSSEEGTKSSSSS